MKLILPAAILLLLLGFIYIVLPHLYKMRIKKLSLKKTKQSHGIWLTFDDGPNPASTPRILEILDRYAAKATFFVLGDKASQNLELMQQLTARGHTIGWHGHKHLHAWYANPFSYIPDLLKFSNIPETKHIRLFRPPFGKLNFFGLLVVWIHRLKLVYWDNDPMDYSQTDGKEIAAMVLKNFDLGKKVVLLHDGRKTSDPEVNNTITALEIILEEMKTRNIPTLTF